MDKEYVWSLDFALEENIWFVPYWYNLLCKFDISDRRLEYIQLPIKNTVEGLYNSSVKVGDIIIMIPSDADSLCLYNIKTRDFLSFPLREKENDIDKFIAYAVYGRFIYLFPYNYPYILKFNIENHEMDYLDFSHNGQPIQTGIQNNTFGKYAFLTVSEYNAIVLYDLENETYEYREIGDGEERYSSILRTEEGEIWLTNQRGEVVIYDLNKCRLERIKIRQPQYDVDMQCVAPCFVGNVEYADSVYFFPGKADMVLKVNKNTHQIEKAAFSDEVCREMDNAFGWRGSHFSIPRGKEIIYFFNIVSRRFFSVDLRNEDVNEYKMELGAFSDEELKILFKQYGTTIQGEKTAKIYVEKGAGYLSLNNYIKMIEKNTGGKKQYSKSVGEMIFRQI